MITLTDTIALDADVFDASGKLPRTTDGYAVLDCPVARSGIQEYMAFEMGSSFSDRDPRSVVRVYRPDSIIFDDPSLKSYTHRPLTNDHPPENVTADNWKKYAIGWTGEEARQDGKRVRVPMLMADGDAIRDVEAGKREWSAGYSVSFDVASGVSPDGETYDAIVTGQKINHIALVDRGRAGPDCRIGDNSASDDALKKDRRMAEIKIVVDGVPVTVGDATAEAVVGKVIAARDAAVTRAETAETSVAALTTSVQAKDAEIATLKQAVEDAKVTPQALRDAASAYAKVLTDAKRIAPDLKLADDADASAVKAAVVSHKLGDAATGWTEAQFDTSFATMAASLPVNDAAEDGIQKVIKDGALNATDAKADFEKAKAKRLAEMRGEKA